MNTDTLKQYAILGAKAEIARLERLIEDLQASPIMAQPVVKKRRKRRKLSPEGRARIVAATKARWAKVHAEKKSAGRTRRKPE